MIGGPTPPPTRQSAGLSTTPSHPETSSLDHLVIRPDRAGTEDFDLTAMVTAVVRERSGNGHALTLETEPLRAHGRPADVMTALIHLLENAEQHGSGRTGVRALRCGERIEVRVSDHGPGLSASLVTMLFQRGARGPNSRGAGLGLHVARTLMRQQGGDLELRRAHGGTTFALVLARANVPAQSVPGAGRTPADDADLAATRAF